MCRTKLLFAVLILMMVCIGICSCTKETGEKSSEDDLVIYDSQKQEIKVNPKFNDRLVFDPQTSKEFSDFEVISLNDSDEAAKNVSWVISDGDNYCLYHGRPRRLHLYELETGKISDLPEPILSHHMSPYIYSVVADDGIILAVSGSHISLTRDGETRAFRNIYGIHTACLKNGRIFALSGSVRSPLVLMMDTDLTILDEFRIESSGFGAPFPPGLYICAGESSISVAALTDNNFHLFSYSGSDIRYEGAMLWFDHQALNFRDSVNIEISKYSQARQPRVRQTLQAFATSYNRVVLQPKYVSNNLFAIVPSSYTKQYLLHLSGENKEIIGLPETGQGRIVGWFLLNKTGKMEILAFHAHPKRGIAAIRYFN